MLRSSWLRRRFQKLRVRKLSLPCNCVICEAPLIDSLSLCKYCKSRLPWMRNQCGGCGIPLAIETYQGLCGRCLMQPLIFESCNTAFNYEQPISTLIGQFKYNANFADGRVLASLLSEAFLRSYKMRINDGGTTGFPHLLVPVPLHPRRLRERGFNQSVEIARVLARDSGVPMNTSLIQRIKDTSTQSQLGAKERRENLRHAFKPGDFAFNKLVSHVAVIDDVVTTMATVTALTALLKSMGISRVDIWAVARATLTY